MACLDTTAQHQRPSAEQNAQTPTKTLNEAAAPKPPLIRDYASL